MRVNGTKTASVTSSTATVSVSSASGIETVRTGGVKLYTGASSLIVESDIAIAYVEIYNPLGQVIRAVRPDSNQAKIDNLPAGILIVKVLLQDGKSETKKVQIGTR